MPRRSRNDRWSPGSWPATPPAPDSATPPTCGCSLPGAPATAFACPTSSAAHLELFTRHMESKGLMRSTVARRLSTLASFYRYCHVEGVLHGIRPPTCAPQGRPRVRARSGLDRNEFGALLVQAGLGSARDHTLISLLSVERAYGFRALNADIEDLDIERGHRTLRIVRKGGQAGRDPARPTDGQSDRLVCRRASRQANLRQRHRPTDESPRCRPDGGNGSPAGPGAGSGDLSPQRLRLSPSHAGAECPRHRR